MEVAGTYSLKGNANQILCYIIYCKNRHHLNAIKFCRFDDTSTTLIIKTNAMQTNAMQWVLPLNYTGAKKLRFIILF